MRKDRVLQPLRKTRALTLEGFCRTGSVKNRAQVLHKSLEDTPDLLNRDVNFVAHSMVRLILEPLPVATGLTTCDRCRVVSTRVT